MSSSSSESEHEYDSSVGSRFVVDEFTDDDDDDVDSMVERTNGYQRAREIFRRLKENDPTLTGVGSGSVADYVCSITDWEQLGEIIAGNSQIKVLDFWSDRSFHDGCTDEQKMVSCFRGLTKSNSINRLYLCSNGLSAVGMRSMVPFLQNANNLKMLDLQDNHVQSEGFYMLIRALQNSPIDV